MKPAIECLAERLRSAGLSDRLSEQVPLAPYTTYRIGGAADLLLEVMSADELQRTWQMAHACGVHCLVLGRGSNVLVSDRGVRGLVLVNRCAGLVLGEDGNVRVDSGVTLTAVARETTAAGLCGLEWAVGIPGSVGGAIVGNAGAHGGYVGDVLEAVTILDESGARRLNRCDLGMGYRTSKLKAIPASNGRPVILDATFALRPGEREVLEQQMTEWLHWREDRQPREPSAGSVFKRTVQYPAGFLIDQAGLKGKRRGDAQVSPKHANFIVNLGAAKASDVRALVEEVQETVEARFGARLELEIELIGEW
jgi:UDP-N-acetylmuramate dehydrogenase